MNELLDKIAPELFLVAVACFLFLLGVSGRPSSRRLAAVIALLSLAAVFVYQLTAGESPAMPAMGTVDSGLWTVSVGPFSQYIRLLVTGVGAVLVLLAWPTNADATGSESINFGQDAGEFFGLMLLSLTGILLVSEANDIILLFLGIELASIPTYIMVSVSRPLPVAQEAGVKYFFLGAMAAALMLFGFSYLYGTTGSIRLDTISAILHPGGAASYATTALTSWQSLAVVIVLAGFSFKIAAVPLHAYAGDVYQGAATPVTAFLAFVPKTSGFLAIIKVMSAVGGPHWAMPPLVIHLLWVVAALTMTVGNVLGLLQFNVKRVLAYSSVAHSGYMLVGLTALAKAAEAFPNDHARAESIQGLALGGVLFYLAAYGIMNAGTFGVLMLLPSRESTTSTTAETFDDLAGQGKQHIALGLAMAVCCFSLIGIPLTVGFVGKVYLIWPALQGGLFWLVVITMANAAISAAYYLKIVAAMFLRPVPDAEFALLGEPTPRPDVAKAPASTVAPPRPSFPLSAAVALSVAGTLIFGTLIPATSGLTRSTMGAAGVVPLPLPIQSTQSPQPQSGPVIARSSLP